MNSTTEELQSSFKICDELRHFPCRTFSSFVVLLLLEVASVVSHIPESPQATHRSPSL